MVIERLSHFRQWIEKKVEEGQALRSKKIVKKN